MRFAGHGPLEIQWGYCPGADVWYPYAMGEAIRWRVCRDGSIPRWTFFSPSDGPLGANIGDPAYENLVLLDDWWIGQTHDCLTRLGGAAIEVRGGVITKAWIFSPGEFEDVNTPAYLISEDGELNSMWDGEDHRMNTLDPRDCGELRFATVLDRGTRTDTP